MVDIIKGSNSADTIYGAGIQEIYGFQGKDRIFASDETVAIYGGSGDDTLLGRDGPTSIYGGSGDDYIHTNRFAGDFFISGGEGNDNIQIYGICTNGSHGVIYGNSGDDYIVNRDGGHICYGGQGNDSLYGGYNTDSSIGNVLYGNSGDDSIQGGIPSSMSPQVIARDALYGGEGNDTVRAGDGDQTLYGGEGDDVVTGQASPSQYQRSINTIYGNSGNDSIIGGVGDNTIDGGDGNDIIECRDGRVDRFGGVSTNIIDGGKGDDMLSGAVGVDVFVYHIKTDGTDILNGFTHIDTLQLTGGGSGGPKNTNFTNVGNDTLITFDHVSDQSITLIGVSAEMVMAHTIFS